MGDRAESPHFIGLAMLSGLTMVGSLAHGCHYQHIDAPNPGDLSTTHWKVVLAAKRPDSPDRMAALTTLCQSY